MEVVYLNQLDLVSDLNLPSYSKFKKGRNNEKT